MSNFKQSLTLKSFFKGIKFYTKYVQSTKETKQNWRKLQKQMSEGSQTVTKSDAVNRRRMHRETWGISCFQRFSYVHPQSESVCSPFDVGTLRNDWQCSQYLKGSSRRSLWRPFHAGNPQTSGGWTVAVPKSAVNALVSRSDKVTDLIIFVYQSEAKTNSTCCGSDRRSLSKTPSWYRRVKTVTSKSIV